MQLRRSSLIVPYLISRAMSEQNLPKFSQFAVAQELLAKGERVEMRVLGQSMLPFFISGQKIKLRPITEQDFKRYNVVFAKDTRKGFVVHRIIAFKGDDVILLGDGNIYQTETIARNCVYGIVDCSPLHIFFAKMWVAMRRFRRFPLAIFRRITPK